MLFRKLKLGINKNINLNFVKTMNINLDFEQNPDGRYHLSKSTTLADFGLQQKESGRLIWYKDPYLWQLFCKQTTPRYYIYTAPRRPYSFG